MSGLGNMQCGACGKLLHIGWIKTPMPIEKYTDNDGNEHTHDPATKRLVMHCSDCMSIVFGSEFKIQCLSCDYNGEVDPNEEQV